MFQNVGKKLKSRKGFTLIELIVVIAILAILAAIAIPKFAGMQNTQKLKADGTTAQAIINSAKIQEADEGTTPITNGASTPVSLGSTAANATSYIRSSYMTIPTPQSGGTFQISYSSGLYTVTWTSTTSGYAGLQTLVEGAAFAPHAY